MNLSIIGKVPSVTNGNLVDSTTGACSDFIEVDNAKHYMLSFSGLSYMYAFLYGADKSYITAQQYNTSGSYDISTITNFNTCKYVRIRVDNKDYIESPQLEEGSSATPFEEYYNYELCKIGNYQDYLYKTNGKNLLELGNGTITNSGLTATITDKKTISMSGTSTAISFCTIISDRLNLGKGTYTLGAFNPIASSDRGMDLRITTTGGSGMLARLYLNVANNTLTFTLNENLVNGRLIVRTSSGVTLNNFIITPMLVKGSTIGEYEPYGSGEWYKKEYIYKENGGNKNWNMNNYDSTYKQFYSTAEYPIGYETQGVNSNKLIMSERFKGAVGNTDGNAVYGGVNTQLIVCIAPLYNGVRFTDTATFKQFLVDNNVHFYIPLATPNDIEITNSNLIEQLNNLEKLKSYNGVTNINCSGNLSAILGISALKGE